MDQGKIICKQLKSIRRSIAAENDIALEIPECTFEGECNGTCPRCEYELQYLEQELTKRSVLGKAAMVAGVTLSLAATANTLSAQNVTPATVTPDIKEIVMDSCRLSGVVKDSQTDEPLIGASVILAKENTIVTGVRTDFYGKFSITIPRGHYKMSFFYIGYINHTIEVDLNTDTMVLPDVSISKSEQYATGITVETGSRMVGMVAPVEKIRSFEQTPSGATFSSDAIDRMPTK